MKTPLFNDFERWQIKAYYNNKVLNPRNFLIDRYEMAKACSDFKKEIKNSVLLKWFINLCLWFN